MKLLAIGIMEVGKGIFLYIYIYVANGCSSRALTEVKQVCYRWSKVDNIIVVYILM